MMIIMLGHELGQIDQTHRRAQPRMNRCALKDRRVSRAKKLHELTPEGPKLGEKVRQSSRVVICFVSASVGQVTGRQLGLMREKLLCAAQPEWLEIHQVTDILLCRPPAVMRSRQDFGRQLPRSFLKSCGRAAQPLQQARKAADWKGEIKGTFKPLLTHSVGDPSVAGQWTVSECRRNWNGNEAARCRRLVARRSLEAVGA
jgi:hypothetical protein